MSPDTLLQRVKRVRVSDTVVDQIIALIEEGKLKVGDQLPGERELVNQLQVGRASLREALRILEAQGVIEVRPGKGAFITGEYTSLPSQEGIKQWFEDHADEVRDMLDIREALERVAASRAASRDKPDLIAEIEAVVDEAEGYLQQGDMDRLGYLDQQFHRLLARASGNVMLAQIVDGIIEAMIDPRRSIQRLPGRAERSLAEHRTISEAIAAGDPDAAEQAVINHINSVRAAIASLSEERA